MTKKSTKGVKIDKPSKPNGRPTLYSPTLGLAIAKLMGQSGALALAAESMGISRATAYRWRDAGIAGDPEYTEFAFLVEQAKAKYCTTLVKKVTKPEWLLSRLEPELFPAEPSNTVVNVSQTQVTLTREQALAELRELALTDPEVAKLLGE